MNNRCGQQMRLCTGRKQRGFFPTEISSPSASSVPPALFSFLIIKITISFASSFPFYHQDVHHHYQFLPFLSSRCPPSSPVPPASSSFSSSRCSSSLSVPQATSSESLSLSRYVQKANVPLVDRPTQLICISDIYLLSTDKYKRHSRAIC